MADDYAITTAQARTHLRITHGDHDEYIDALIAAATSLIEGDVGRRLITTTETQTFDAFPSVIQPRWVKLASVTGIAYLDSDGDSQDLSSSVYRVGTDSEPGRIVEAYGQSWPTTYPVIEAVTLTYTAGYGDSATDVPGIFRHMLRLVVAQFYEHSKPATEVRLTDLSYGLQNMIMQTRIANH